MRLECANPACTNPKNPIDVPDDTVVKDLPVLEWWERRKKLCRVCFEQSNVAPSKPQHPAAKAAASRRKKSIEQTFQEFHANNPGVYEALVKVARHEVANGATRLSINGLYEVVRHLARVKTIDLDSDFKLNNTYRSRYVRLIEANEPDLAGLFEKRELKSA